MVRRLKSLVNRVPRELRTAWYDRVRIHELRVGVCGCAMDYDHKLEGKRVVLANRVCQIKEIPISEAIGCGGFDKQKKELKASRCHFLLEQHGQKTELLVCQIYKGKRFYIGEQSSELPWLAKREKRWEGKPGLRELLKGMRQLSLTLKKPQEWLSQ